MINDEILNSDWTFLLNKEIVRIIKKYALFIVF